MSWKCDKCKTVYSDNVKKVGSGEFNFCPTCLNGEAVEEKEIIKKNKSALYIKILLISSAVILVGAIVSGLFFVKTALVSVSIPIWITGFVIVIVLMGINDVLIKRNR